MAAIHPDETLVSAVMVPDVVCVSRDTSIEELSRLFLARGISGAPVTDGEGRPIGIVSKTDLLGIGRDKRCVGDIMMPSPFCVGTDESVAKTAGLMAFEGLHRVAVVDRGGRVIGIVSSLDVMRWLARESGYSIANRP